MSNLRPALSSYSTALSILFIVLSGPFSNSPKDALCLVSIETQDLFREASLHPGQLAVWIALLLECHHLLQGRAKHGGAEDGISGMLDLLQTGLLQALKRERDTHTHTQEFMLMQQGR